MAEITSDDRKWILTIANLRDLQNHPAWNTYKEEVVDVIICDIQDMLLNKVESVEQIKALRILLKALIKLRDRPEELLATSKRVRADFNIPPDEESINVRSAAE